MASSRALTSTHSLLKLFSFSPVLNASPVLVRSFGSSALPETSSDSDSYSESDIPTNESDSDSDSKLPQHPSGAKACPLVNQFLKEGRMIPFKVVKDDEAMYARLDMPGIGKEGLKMWVEDNSLHVKGVEEVDEKKVDNPVMEEDGPRKFSGDISLPQGRYKVEEIEAELKNGVLNIMVPKIKLEDRKNVINIKVK